MNNININTELARVLGKVDVQVTLEIPHKGGPSGFRTGVLSGLPPFMAEEPSTLLAMAKKAAGLAPGITTRMVECKVIKVSRV